MKRSYALPSGRTSPCWSLVPCLKERRGKIDPGLTKGAQGGTGEPETEKEKECSAEVPRHSNGGHGVQCTQVRPHSRASKEAWVFGVFLF